VRRMPTSHAIAAALGCALVLQGCASAPFDLGGSEQVELGTSEQQALRRAAHTLRDTVAEQGWRVDTSGNSGALGFFSRLVTGEGDEANEDPAETPAMAYITSDEADAISLLQSDIERATRLTADVADAADRVASSNTSYEQDAINRDIARAEAALTAARRAKSYFSDVSGQLVTQEGDGTSLAPVESGLNGLETEITRLAASADRLAERRWASGSANVG